MSSVSNISSIASSIVEQLSAAAESRNADNIKKLAAAYQQTQTQNYLTDLADSLAESDQAASETLQALSKQITDTQDHFQKAIENAPAPGQTADIAQTLYPVTQKTTVSDITGASTAAAQETKENAKTAQTGTPSADTRAEKAAEAPSAVNVSNTPDSYDFVQALYQNPTAPIASPGKALNVVV
jgi:chemotaxis protein histidine kinase CheA